MTLDVQCGRLSLIHVQVHTTHSWLRACLSCPLTPITSQKFCSLLSLTMFWYVGLNLYKGTCSFLVPEHTYFKKVSFSSLWIWLHHFSTSKTETKRHWYSLCSYDLQSPESPQRPFTSIALSEKEEGSMCPGNWVTTSPSHILFTESLPAPSPLLPVSCDTWATADLVKLSHMTQDHMIWENESVVDQQSCSSPMKNKKVLLWLDSFSWEFELKHVGRIFQYAVRSKARCSKKKVMGSSYARDTWKDTEILGDTRKGHPGKNNGSRLIRFFWTKALKCLLLDVCSGNKNSEEWKCDFWK